MLRHNCLWSAGSPFLKDSYFHCCCGGTRWTQTGTDALGAFTHHTNKKITHQICAASFYNRRRPRQTTDMSRLIDPSWPEPSLARALSALCWQKKRWFRRRIRDARGKRKSERSYYTHARRHKHSNWPPERGNPPESTISTHKRATHRLAERSGRRVHTAGTTGLVSCRRALLLPLPNLATTNR